MKTFFKEIFTDALNRPEVKMILGIPIAIAAVVYGLVARDWIGFAALSGFAASLIFATTAGDAAIDKAQIAAGGAQ